MLKAIPFLLGLVLAGSASLAAQDRRAAVLDSIVAQPATGPGCAVGVRHNGEVTLRRSYGMADLEHQVPITPASVFYTGSLSKQVTAMAVAMLARDGVIDLDAPAAKWIPEMTGPLASITIRQMVHHTSGLREKWDLLAMQGVPTDRTVVTQQMVLDLVSKQRELNFTPGSRHLYNNTAYDLLATLVGRASGMSFREFVQQRIFAPRGMTRSLFLDRWNAILPDRAEGYAWEGYPEAYMVRAPALVETVGSGSLHSTLDDMLKWVAWFDDATAADSALITLLETPGTLTTGNATNYAFGLIVDEWEGHRRVHHSGSLAGYRTAVWRIPAIRWSAVVLCNNSTARPDFTMWEQFLHSMGRPWVDRLGSVSTVAPGIMNSNVIPDDLPGEYVSPELGVTWVITRQPEYMRITGPGIVDDHVRLSSTAMRVDYRWEVRVERDASGTIVALLVDTGRSIGVRFTPPPSAARAAGSPR
jgi:CubicO group peptidase (beta-lactamase class C family)